MKSMNALSLKALLGCNEVCIRPPTAQVVATLNTANLLWGLAVEKCNLSIQCCHRNLLPIWFVCHTQPWGREHISFINGSLIHLENLNMTQHLRQNMPTPVTWIEKTNISIKFMINIDPCFDLFKSGLLFYKSVWLMDTLARANLLICCTLFTPCIMMH